MGRKSQARELAAWVNGKLAGLWRIPSRGAMEFVYDPQWIDSDESWQLSLFLPLTLDNVPLKGWIRYCRV